MPATWKDVPVTLGPAQVSLNQPCVHVADHCKMQLPSFVRPLPAHSEPPPKHPRPAHGSPTLRAVWPRPSTHQSFSWPIGAW